MCEDQGHFGKVSVLAVDGTRCKRTETHEPAYFKQQLYTFEGNSIGMIEPLSSSKKPVTLHSVHGSVPLTST